MDLDDLQLLRNGARQEAEIMATFYEAYIAAGLSHNAAEQLTLARWNQLFNNPASDLQKALESMTEALGKLVQPEDD